LRTTMVKRKCMEVVLFMQLTLLTEVASRIFNKIAYNKRPLQAPYKTIDINKAARCYSMLIDPQSNPTALKCLLYNTTIDYLQLEEQGNAEKSVFYSAQMRLFGLVQRRRKRNRDLCHCHLWRIYKTSEMQHGNRWRRLAGLSVST